MDAIMKNEPSRPLESRQKAVLLMAALVLLLLPTAAGVSACERNAGVSPSAGPSRSGAIGGHRRRGEPSWWKCHDAETHSRNASPLQRACNTGKSAR